MSRRVSIFSFRRLFSSSSCRFLFLRRWTSLPELLPPDSGSNNNMKFFCAHYSQTYVIYPLAPVLWKMLFIYLFIFIFTYYPLSIFKSPCLASQIHGRRSMFKAQLHFSCWTIQLTEDSQKQLLSIRHNSTFWARTSFSRPCVSFHGIFNKESTAAETQSQKCSELTVWRLDKDADLRGGIFFGLNVFPKNGIFSDILISC